MIRRGNVPSVWDIGQVAEQVPHEKQAEMSVAPKRWMSGYRPRSRRTAVGAAGVVPAGAVVAVIRTPARWLRR